MIVLLFLLVAAAVSAGALMFALFRQSASAQVGQAQAEIGRACEAIQAAYRSSGEAPSTEGGGAGLGYTLTQIVERALRDRAGVEGGVWRDGARSLAYAFPTYQGAGPKTDLPQAELPRIETVNRAALAGDRAVSGRFDGSSQILLIAACPLQGAEAGLTAWTMTRVFTFAGDSYRLLMAGLAVLMASVLIAATLLTRLTMSWSRHVGRIEAALQQHDVSELPALPTTGERELDRIVTALNQTGQRLAQARRTADRLARDLAAGERLAAIGRVAAGLAHETRNPIAAMRLKAENAIVGDAQRKDQALSAILGQVDRLDALLGRLLSVTAREKSQRVPVRLAPFLQACIAGHSEIATAKRLSLLCRADAEEGSFDPDQVRSALDNLVLNAVQAAPPGSTVLLAALHGEGALTLSVHDDGPGPAESVREHLFEPFVTGRPDGVGLGLSLVREVAAAHGGEARIAASQTGTTFEIVLPCP